MSCRNSKTDKKKYNKDYYAANKKALVEYSRAYYHSHKEDTVREHRAWARGIKARFGITPADYDKMYREQKGRCLICFAHQSELRTRLAIDHDHEAGQIRGLLCGPCNTKLGWYELRKQQIIDYLGEIQ